MQPGASHKPPHLLKQYQFAVTRIFNYPTVAFTLQFCLSVRGSPNDAHSVNV